MEIGWELSWFLWFFAVMEHTGLGAGLVLSLGWFVG